MLYVRFPLSLRNVEHLLHERGVEISYEFREVRVAKVWLSLCNFPNCGWGGDFLAGGPVVIFVHPSNEFKKELKNTPKALTDQLFELKSVIKTMRFDER